MTIKELEALPEQERFQILDNLAANHFGTFYCEHLLFHLWLIWLREKKVDYSI